MVFFFILNSVSELYEYAMLPEHRTSVHPSVYPSTISDTGALSVSSGLKTGRTPKEKRVVLDEKTNNVITSISLYIINRPSGGAT